MGRRARANLSALALTVALSLPATLGCPPQVKTILGYVLILWLFLTKRRGGAAASRADNTAFDKSAALSA